MLKDYLPFAQIIIAVLLIASILLQQRGTALGSALGGGGSESVYATRRGIQKKLLFATITLGVLFILLAIINLLTS